MADWNTNHISEWLFDACRVLPDISDKIIRHVTLCQNPGAALAHLSLKDLKNICGENDCVPDCHPMGSAYWHANAIFHEIALRKEYQERYVFKSLPCMLSFYSKIFNIYLLCRPMALQWNTPRPQHCSHCD